MTVTASGFSCLSRVSRNLIEADANGNGESDFFFHSSPNLVGDFKRSFLLEKRSPSQFNPALINIIINAIFLNSLEIFNRDESIKPRQ